MSDSERIRHKLRAKLQYNLNGDEVQNWRDFTVGYNSTEQNSYEQIPMDMNSFSTLFHTHSNYIATFVQSRTRELIPSLKFP